MEEKSETEEQRLARSAFEATLRIQKKKTLKLEEEKAKKEIPTKDVNAKVSQSFIEDEKVENSIQKKKTEEMAAIAYANRLAREERE